MPDREVLDLLAVETRILHAWVAFRHSHDMKSAEMTCCSRTKELFAALQELEDLVRASAQRVQVPNGKLN